MNRITWYHHRVWDHQPFPLSYSPYTLSIHIPLSLLSVCLSACLPALCLYRFISPLFIRFNMIILLLLLWYLWFGNNVVSSRLSLFSFSFYLLPHPTPIFLSLFNSVILGTKQHTPPKVGITHIIIIIISTYDVIYVIWCYM